MTSRSGIWRRLKGVLAGILLILPLFQIAAPGLLALAAADDGVWCVSIASLDGNSNSQGQSDDADDCLVCLAVAIGGSSAAPAAPTLPAPRQSIMIGVPDPLSGKSESIAETCPPIRAPPIA